MATVKLMNKDETGTAPENKVTSEAVPVTKGTPQSLAHTFFFEEGFALYSDALRTHKLQRGRDFNFAEEDTVATEISNKNCWRKIVIYKDIPQAYADYQVYGDVVSAETINDINEQIGNVATNAGNIDKLLKDTKQDLINHKADTKAHGASSAVLSNSLALRTATGTLKAHDAFESDDLVNLSVLNEKQQEQDKDLQNKIRETQNNLLQKIQANEAVLTKEDFDDGTLDPAAPDYEEQLAARLEAHVNDLKPHRNVIRNKDGNLTTGQATLETEAVNKKQLDKAFRDLVGTAPETLDTIYEIAEALQGNANIVNTISGTITAGDATTLASAKSYTDTKVAETLADGFAYTDGKLTNYYTKAEVDASQAAQDTRLTALEAAPTGAGTVYDFSRTDAIKTGDKIKLSNGTVKDVWRLCVEKEGTEAGENFLISITETVNSVFAIHGIAKGENTVQIQEAYIVKYKEGKLYLIAKDGTSLYSKINVVFDFY